MSEVARSRSDGGGEVNISIIACGKHAMEVLPYIFCIYTHMISKCISILNFSLNKVCVASIRPYSRFILDGRNFKGGDVMM